MLYRPGHLSMNIKQCFNNAPNMSTFCKSKMRPSFLDDPRVYILGNVGTGKRKKKRKKEMKSKKKNKKIIHTVHVQKGTQAVH